MPTILPNAQITLLIPDLIPPPGMGRAFWDALDAPCLKRLLTRAQWRRGIASDGPAWLAREFNVAALAPVMAQADGLDATTGYWLNATPAHVEARRTSLVLSDPALLMLDATASAALAAMLTLHLAGEGLALYAPNPARWYVRSETPLPMSSTHPAAAVGRDIQSFAPHFAPHKNAQRLLTEIQMLLHAHPVNEARSARGALPVNHLWLWGGGVMNTQGKNTKPYTSVHSNDFAVRALAAHTHARCEATPAQLNARLLSEDSHLLTSEMLEATLRRDGPDAWSAAVTHLERDWFQPLVELRVETLNIITSAAEGLQQFIARPRDKYKIFNKNKYL